jgi:hypothetical protein
MDRLSANRIERQDGMGDEEDGFCYDLLRLPTAAPRG